MSLPSWERGLKLFMLTVPVLYTPVAPFVGAWIETQTPDITVQAVSVAPFVGAWIETRYVLTGLEEVQ